MGFRRGWQLGVLTKTRWSYEKACKEYQEDLRHMKALLKLAPSSAKELTLERLKRID